MREKNIYKLFKISLIFKGIQAFIELILGSVFLYVKTGSISILIESMTKAELTEDPNDYVFRHIYDFAQNFSTNDKSFLSLYLLSHGVVKVILVAGILKNKSWAYPIFIIVQIFFCVYEIYITAHRQSLFFGIMSAFDILILWLVWHEYKLKKKHHIL
jgi:uncharacterized membrane protein